MYSTTSIKSCIAAFAVACAPAAGTRPTDMSAAQHEAAAQSEMERAEELASQTGDATPTRTRCSSGQSRVCWTEPLNEAEARKHRELAAQHRAASEGLRNAEARACRGIEPEDRDMSPFAHGDVAGVSELRGPGSGQGWPPHGGSVVGATVTLNAVPGLTEQWLQRVVDCHLARNASVGNEMPEMPSCPLVPRGASATVRPTDTGFAVDIRANDPDSAAEILRRAEALASR